MGKNSWISKKLVSSIGFVLGKYVERYEYPTAHLLATTNLDAETACRVARYLNLRVRLHYGVWQEKGISIKELIKTKQHGKEKEKQI